MKIRHLLLFTGPHTQGASLPVACALFLTTATALLAQGLDPALLKKPATDAWPTYHGDYSGKRYSVLDQINQSNVNKLTRCV